MEGTSRSSLSRSGTEVSRCSGRSVRAKTNPSVRFTASLAVLLTAGAATTACHALALSDSSFSSFLGSLGLQLIAFFGLEWTRLYLPALTRRKRAHFDVANVLATYQPRARTHGHLFQPDPPTPGPDGKQVKFTENENDAPKRSKSEQDSFMQLRDQHYTNMWEEAQRLNNENQDDTNTAKEKSEKRE